MRIRCRCDLQDLAYSWGSKNLPSCDGDVCTERTGQHQPLLHRDMNKCILCGRCVGHATSPGTTPSTPVRGIKAAVHPPVGSKLEESDCVFCGQCVRCAPWEPSPKKAVGQDEHGGQTVHTTCPYCGVGCQLDLHVQETGSPV